jgi:CheY-like chemotaxis protein
MESDGTELPVVLVVDDEAEIGDVMRRMLGRLLPTATVDAVLSAAQAIELLTPRLRSQRCIVARSFI